MKTYARYSCAVVLTVSALACSDEKDDRQAADDTATSLAATSSGGSSIGSNGSSARSNGSSSTGSGGASASVGGTTGTSGSGGASDAGAAGQAGAAGSGSCDPTIDSALGLVDAVSIGTVTVEDDTDGTITLRVDATAGGYLNQAENPYTYVTLSNAARLEVSDLDATHSPDWDLAFKRDHVRSNSGDSGPGGGGVIALDGAIFEAVTSSDVDAAEFVTDEFLDGYDCEAPDNPGEKPTTAFGTWYDYDPESMTLSRADRVYVVRGADGSSLYKFEFLDYYKAVDDPDLGTVTVSAIYTVRYALLD